MEQNKLTPVDFFIRQTPVAITLECPHCDFDINIPFNEVDVPEYWGDDWGSVTCPYCEKEIKLGEYDI